MEDKEGNWWPDAVEIKPKTYKESEELRKRYFTFQTPLHSLYLT